MTRPAQELSCCRANRAARPLAVVLAPLGSFKITLHSLIYLLMIGMLCKKNVANNFLPGMIRVLF